MSIRLFVRRTLLVIALLMSICAVALIAGGGLGWLIDRIEKGLLAPPHLPLPAPYCYSLEWGPEAVIDPLYNCVAREQFLYGVILLIAAGAAWAVARRITR